ncbi:MAG: uroporphyrinogen-III C-methyltransferase [Halanaerobiaceae bacterium]
MNNFQVEEKTGTVFLVGAGPGDHRLLTGRGKDLLSQVDVVVYDRLVNPSLLAFVPSGTEIIYAGKSRREHSLTQKEINNLLVEKAGQGKDVLRLKGGDPFVYGRGGEEASFLRENNIEFVIVPGISSVIGALAYAGIPVTDRRFCSSFHVFTGHKPEALESKKIASLAGTKIIVMGLKKLPQTTQMLIEEGLDPGTPAAVIHYGTTSDQVVVQGTVDNIARKAKKAELKPPVIIVIGEVVSLRQELEWFSKGVLSGKRIIVTRPRGQFLEMGHQLEDAGAEVLYFPTIEIKGPLVNENVEKTIMQVDKYDWLFFTSVNGVKYFFQLLYKFNIDLRDLAEVKFAALGAKTAQALEEKGFFADLVPEKFTSQALQEEFLQKIASKPKKRLLFARSDIAPVEIVENLTRAGFEVDNLSIYQTTKPEGREQILTHHLRERVPELITFTSSSTVKNLMSMTGDKQDLIQKIPAACIGPVTANKARELGFNVVLEASTHTARGLIADIKNYFWLQQNNK